MSEVIDTNITVEIVPAPSIPTHHRITGKKGDTIRPILEVVCGDVRLLGRIDTKKESHRAGVVSVYIPAKLPSEKKLAELAVAGDFAEIRKLCKVEDRLLSGQALLLSLQGVAVKGWKMPISMRKEILAAIKRNGDLVTD